MALKSELMAFSFPYEAAALEGFDPVTSFTAAGTTQLTATTLTANNANVTTSSSGAGVILGSARESYNIYNAGPFALSIYPVVGCTFTGLALNAPVTIAYNTTAWIKGGGLAGNTWISG